MHRKIKISAVSYLNTKPLIWGIQHHPILNQIDLSLDIPSVCAQKLIDKEVDMAFAPVATMPKMKTAYLNTNYCISCNGAVRTVCLFSEQPIENISTVLLDYHSRTSVQLCRTLFKHHWKKKVAFINAEKGFENQIGGATAGLIIGDRAIPIFDKYPYVYDLGKVWKDYTGLPFVFAGWISHEPLPELFVQEFNDALLLGLNNKEKIIDNLVSSYPNFNVRKYLNQYIEFELDAKKRKALKLFLSTFEETMESSLMISENE